MHFTNEKISGRGFDYFGINKHCLECKRLASCDHPQYNAPHLTRFYCRYFLKKK